MIDDDSLLHFVEDWWRCMVLYDPDTKDYVDNIFKNIHKQHFVDFLRDALVEFKIEKTIAPLELFDEAVLVSTEGYAWAPSSLPCFIVSACCPFSQNTPLHRLLDEPLHESLRRRIEGLPGASCEAVVGQSVDGSWREPSWAIYGISEEQAIDLGKLYQQWAIFRWDENGRVVIAC